jgi:hypothetical protein
VNAPATTRLRGMVHADPHTTEIAAAEKIVPRLRDLHLKVLGELKVCGPMTDEQLERLPAFANYGPSTVRKRRSELYQAGFIEPCGEQQNSRGISMKIWRPTVGNGGF